MVAFHLLAAALIATAAAAAAEPADLAAATTAAAAGAEPLATCAAAAFLNNTDFHDGQGLGHAPGKDAADCCTQCASSAWAAKGCKFFTLSVISGVGTCWFKKDDSGRRYIAGAISGGVSGAPLGPAPPAPPTALCPDPSKINIACVGDSITFGAHSSGGQNYPAQLQGMLDKKYPGKETPLLRHFCIKCIILPRQARDKHRENSKKSGAPVRQILRCEARHLRRHDAEASGAKNGIFFWSFPYVCPEPVLVK
jgi:hypothetical protein